MDWWVIFEIFIGAVLAVGFVMLVEYLRKPRLILRLADPAHGIYPAGRPAKTSKVLRLIVENKKLPWLARWMSRNVSVHCYGFITFCHLAGQNVFDERSMPIKWTRAPGVQLFPDGRVKAKTFDSVAYMDVHAGETEELDVATQYDDDAECYGWCYDNYFSEPRWRNPDWRLNSGQYLVKVEVISAGERCVGLFRLINDVPVKGFRLENAQPSDYKVIFIKP